jgi:hypothetical protein
MVSRVRVVSALSVSVLALLLYRATLLPGVDLGDTGSFQVMAGEPTITPRDAYPLYFAIGDAVVWISGGDQARALNLASALEGAAACGLLVLVAAELSGSIGAAVAAGLLFAGSYTFWSQAIIAEVYSLHMCFVALSMFALLRWQRHPAMGSLAVFFAVYALGFGNHLSMILLAPAYTLFLIIAAPRRWRGIVTPPIVLMAASIAALGSLQYLWNLRALWLAPVPPRNVWAALSTSWFDVTKTDWRQTTIAGIAPGLMAERCRMYLFDLLQQFGVAGPPLAAAGAVYLAVTATRRAALLVAAYAGNMLFAMSYNVGDTHVFLLPAHLIVSLFIACGIALVQSASGRTASASLSSHRLNQRATRVARLVGVIVIGAIAVGRIWDNYPALDRSGDRRPAELLDLATRAIDDRQAILVSDLNWQLENGLRYFAKRLRPAVAWTRMVDVADHAGTLIRDNLAVGRDVVLTERAKDMLEEAYGPIFPIEGEDVPPATLAGLARELPARTRYVLCILRPAREFPLDSRDLAEALGMLTGGQVTLEGSEDYVALAGTVGERPVLLRSSSRPFRVSVIVDAVPVQVRMESWLAFDTIRRMGFGQVVAAHRHALIVERGVSFVALDGDGRAIRARYTASLYARPRRYVIHART